ncbi:hypothetical protein [Niallia circulans]
MPVEVVVFSLTVVLLLLLEFPDELGVEVLEEEVPGLETYRTSPG